MKKMKLEKFIFTAEIAPDILVKEYGFQLFEGGELIRVNSAPNIIEFGGALFIAGFIFSDNQLYEIHLMPIIEGVKAPNYPDENYQEIKMDYCIKILYGMYGESVHSEDSYMAWENEKYIISCSKIMVGKGKYSGGDITIKSKR